ncbi:MAG: hypothetical protein J6M92_13255 [Oribacterium sp.]|nr:hypothetical protein [Oribacterium sp.]
MTGENSGYEVPAEALAEKGQAVVIELMDIPESMKKQLERRHLEVLLDNVREKQQGLLAS